MKTMKQELNFTARDSMVNQITDAMYALQEIKRDVETAIDYMEQARNSSYTEPMEEVRAILIIVSERLDVDIRPNFENTVNLAGVADQIHRGEQSNGSKD